MWVSLLGILAAVCTTFAFLPQALKTIKTRQTEDLSLVMLSLQAFGNLCWAQYGYLISEVTLVVANVFTLCLVMAIWSLKVSRR